MVVNLREIRNNCRLKAEAYNFSTQLFDRIPMYIFSYFSCNPFDAFLGHGISHIDLITTFVLINEISEELIVSFYKCGGQQPEVLRKLNTYFNNILTLYNSTPEDGLLAVFGTYFTYHLKSRSLRRINKEVVRYGRREGAVSTAVTREYFNLSDNDWKRLRELRFSIRNGTFRVSDSHDLDDYRRARMHGLYYRGAKK